MEDIEKELEKAIKRLTRTTAHWIEIKKILQEDIRETQDLITLIDSYLKEKEDKLTKLN